MKKLITLMLGFAIITIEAQTTWYYPQTAQKGIAHIKRHKVAYALTAATVCALSGIVYLLYKFGEEQPVPAASIETIARNKYLNVFHVGHIREKEAWLTVHLSHMRLANRIMYGEWLLAKKVQQNAELAAQQHSRR